MRAHLTLAAMVLALAGCLNEGGDRADGSGNPGPSVSSLLGSWEDTLYTPAPRDNKVFHRITFGPGHAFSRQATDFDRDGGGNWVERATLGTTGSTNTFAEIPGGDGYLLLEGAFRAGDQAIEYQEAAKCQVVAGKLEFTNAHVLMGTSTTLQGTWLSILDSTRINFPVDKFFFSFTITPAGKFISPYLGDTLDVAVSAGSFTVEDSSILGPFTVAYHIANGRLFLDRTDTKLTLRKKGG